MSVRHYCDRCGVEVHQRDISTIVFEESSDSPVFGRVNAGARLYLAICPTCHGPVRDGLRTLFPEFTKAVNQGR